MKNNPVIYDLQKVLLTTIQDVLPVCVKASFYQRPFSYKRHPSKLRFSYITKQISFLPKRQLETQFMSMVYKKKRDYIIITIT